MKWLWLAIAGALGLWLILLLMVSGPDDEKKPASERASSKPKGFDTPAAGAFSKRPPVKSARPLPSFPVAPDQGKSE